MNAEIKTLNHFERAGFDAGQSKAVVVGIDDLLVKSMAAFNHRMDAIDHRFGSIDHRIDVLEKSMRLQTISLVATLLIGFTGLIYALLR